MSKKHEVGTVGPSSPARARASAHCSPRSSPSAGLPLVLAGRDEARLTEVRQRVQRLGSGRRRRTRRRRPRQPGGRRGAGCGTGRTRGRRPDQQCGLRDLRPAAGDRRRPRARPDRRQRRRVGAPHARGAARNAGTRARPDSERRVDHRVSARPVSGHLRRLEGVRAVVQSGAVGRDARLGRQA